MRRFSLDKDDFHSGCTITKEETTVSALGGENFYDELNKRKLRKRVPVNRKESRQAKNVTSNQSIAECGKVIPIINVELEKTISENVPAFTCTICKNGVKMNVIEFKAHYQLQHEGKKLPRAAKYLHLYTCDVCLKLFKSWRHLQNHMEIHNNLYDCELCGVNFKKPMHYILHMHLHCKEDLFKCIYCEYNTSNVNEITDHLNKKHEIINYKYVCKICEKGFNLFTWFKEHSNYHSGEKPFKCKLCEKSFLYSRHLTAHKVCVHKLSMPHVLKTCQCEICGKRYQCRNSLKIHMNIHTGKTSTVVICEICGKQLANLESLKFHIRVHTGYKPFKCNYCEKTFTKKPILVEHERIHTGNRPYTCGYCKKSFSQRSSMVIHIRTHTGERPYVCHICGKAFVARAMLTVHFRTCKGYH